MKKVFIFALGAAIGSLVTWKIVEEKYKQLANEEIESVVRRFNDRLNEFENKNNAKAKTPEVPWGEESSDKDKEKYKDQVNNLDYDAKEDEECTVKVEQPREYIAPYVISPEEFGEFGNRTKSLIYYSDFTLADDDDDIISDPESIIGDALEHFGEYEDDAVHIRNENIECDFEILKSL